MKLLLASVAFSVLRRRVVVDIAGSGDVVQVVVADDGRGFDTLSEPGAPGHFGLLGMREGRFLYIANTDGVARVKLGADGKATGTPQKVNEYSKDGGHWTRSILFGADGAMYVAIGSTCNICEEATPDRAAVMRYDANGKNGRLYSSGLRNAVGMALHPTTQQVWVTQHERDNIRPDHENLPPEEINILRDGAHYGWPYCHSNRVPNPEFAETTRCPSTEPPALGMQAQGECQSGQDQPGQRDRDRSSCGGLGEITLAVHGSAPDIIRVPE